jgi:hypothetical protein
VTPNICRTFSCHTPSAENLEVATRFWKICQKVFIYYLFAVYALKYSVEWKDDWSITNSKLSETGARGGIEVLYLNLSGRAQRDHNNFSPNSWCSNRK